MLGGMHLQVKQTWGEGKDIVPETPPPKIVLDRDSLSTQVCSASDQLTATQLIRVQGSASPFVVGRGARGGADWGCVDSELGVFA